MLLKLGVDISRLADPMRRAMAKVDAVYIDVTGAEAVCTSTYEGAHSVASLHYVNRAADFRLPPPALREKVVVQLRAKLGPEFDVVLEGSHIHVEHDPK